MRSCEGDMLEASKPATPRTHGDTIECESRGNDKKSTVGSILYITFKWHTVIYRFKHPGNPSSPTGLKDTKSSPTDAEYPTATIRTFKSHLEHLHPLGRSLGQPPLQTQVRPQFYRPYPQYHQWNPTRAPRSWIQGLLII